MRPTRSRRARVRERTIEPGEPGELGAVVPVGPRYHCSPEHKKHPGTWGAA